MSTPKSATSGKRPRLRSALAQVRAELLAIPESELLVINLEPLTIVTITCGAIPELAKVRGDIERLLPTFDPGKLDRLETYALALMQANSAYLATREPPKDRARLAEEARGMRALLLQDVVTLQGRGYMTDANLSELRGPNGHLNVACDLMTLANLLRDDWDEVSSICAVTLDELDRAEVLCEDLTSVSNQRAKRVESVFSAALQRRRAFTLLVRTYTEVRRAVAYVRPCSKDVDRIAPSYFRKKKTRKIQEQSVPSEHQLNELGAAERAVPVVPEATHLSDTDPFLH